MHQVKIPIFVVMFSLVFAVALAANPRRDNYPEEWWKPVPHEGAPSWEILPQEAAPGEVILSKRNELGILSNFAPTPFTYRAHHYASVEGFWQMLKYPEGPRDDRLKDGSIKWPFSREQVAQMTSFEAKKAGDQASEIMKKLGIDWVTFEGKKLAYHEQKQGHFYDLIVAAEWAKLKQNPKVKEILLKTGNLILKPDHHQEADAAPAWKYNDIWMMIRSKEGAISATHKSKT
jgi:predicted NAD-dependent protein-ADP-ribosyltransferase YbiA (DUF1768 family)